MDKPRYFYKNTCHHLYNRGAHKERIFFEEENYIFFLARLKYYKDKYRIEILSYCLMPNHFHLFVRQLTEESSISVFISSLLNSYTKSVNRRYDKSGTLFQGKTKSKPVDDENYFKWIIKYLLENPVNAGMVKHITDWEYSNAKELFGIRNNGITCVEHVVSFFQNEKLMREFLLSK